MKLKVSVPEGKTLYQVLREKGFMRSAYCGGRGICGKCIVKVGEKEELACLLFGPFEGEVEIPEENLISKGEALPDIPVESREGFGIAVDLGTTGVEAALFDLSNGKFIKSLKTLNFQSAFGADVVTRVELARENYDKERELLLKTLSFLFKELGVPVKEAVVVSNSVIHHFLLGLPVSGFERFPFKLELEEEVCTTGRELGLEEFEDTVFYVPPPLKSFIGSDFFSNLLVLTKESSNFGVADLGTNAEMGIWKEGEGVAASVPAGPAFEGVGLFSGMRAVEGAIYKVFFDGRDFRFLTIGNREPLGICASGYFDLIYLLKSFRVLTEEGTIRAENIPPLITQRIREINGERAFILYESEDVLIALTQSDIRKFLLAKGAVYGALKTLSEEAGAPEKLFFSGAFGSHIDRRSVKGLKLIPENFPEPVAAGNLALKGASLLLGRREEREKIKEIKRAVQPVELATNKTFEKAYIEGMEL